MLKKVFIVGGDGFARECYNNLTLLDEYGKDVIFGGFLGHNGYGHTVNYKSYQHLYIGEVAEHEFKDDEFCIIGAGYPELRSKIYADLKKQGAKFYTLIGRGVHFPFSSHYGEANIFVPPFYPSVDVEIGNNNVFNGSVTLGHDVVVGDCNFFGPYSKILGYIRVGSFNTIGTSAILLAHTRLGDYNKVAPMSVVYKGFKDYCYIAGNPALKIGEVEGSEKCQSNL